MRIDDSKLAIASTLIETENHSYKLQRFGINQKFILAQIVFFIALLIIKEIHIKMDNNNTEQISDREMDITEDELSLQVPIGGVPYQDWTIVNYVDLEPGSGLQDFRGGNYTYNGHNGIDFTLPHFEAMDDGVPVYASLPGTVTQVSDTYPDRCSTENPCNTPANLIKIDHGDNLITRYLHLRTDSASVSVGDSVEAGQQIGLVGSSGNSTDAHLHFEVIDDGEVIEVNTPNDKFSWQSPIAYADDVVGSLDYDITDHLPSFEELRERPDTVDTYIQQPGLNPHIWTHLHGVDQGDKLDFYFHKPDGTQYAHLNWSAPQIRYGWWNAGIELPDVPDLGVWEVEFQHNGSTILTDTFTVLPKSSDGAITVDTLVDENDGDYSAGDLSLREAIAIANERDGKDIITFDDSLSGGTIGLTETETAPRPGTINQELLITDSVQIDGLGANNLTLDGVNGGGGIFRIEGENIDVTLTGLNLVNGYRQQFFVQNATFGGAILVNDSNGNLTLQNSVIANSRASYAGAISSRGDVNIFGSTIENNESGRGGEFFAGAVRVGENGKLTVINSTIANNSDRGIFSQGSTEISNSTLIDGVLSNELTLTSSIVLNNFDSNVASIEGNPVITSGGNNLIGNGDNLDGFVDTDLVGTADNLLDPRLGELQNNGGSTKTIALLDDSPAIDAGSNPNNLETDQRGVGFNRTVGNGTDIGAYEVQTMIGNDDIVGTDKSDFLRGTAEHDRIFGLDGADYLDGLAGDDFLSGGNGNDYLKGRNGDDIIEGDAGNDLIQGGKGADVLRGGDGRDRILGGNGADTIDDGAGNDVLFGGRGDDVFLAANPGYDLFTGGNGSDSYVYELNSDASFGRDRILDFNQSEDKIAFRPFVEDLAAFDEFADLDTDDSGVLDSADERIHVRGISTVIDFSDLFGHSHNSDKITLIGVNNLDANNFIFNATAIN